MAHEVVITQIAQEFTAFTSIQVCRHLHGRREWEVSFVRSNHDILHQDGV